MKPSLYLLLVISSVSVLAQSESTEYPVYGKIISGLNGLPLQGIVVSVATDWDSVTTTTDANGMYSLNVTEIENDQTIIENSIEYLTSQDNVKFNIRSSGEHDALVTVYDITGAEVDKYSFKLNYGANTLRINTLKLAQAVYLIKIDTEERSYIQKLVKSGNNMFWGSRPITIQRENTWSNKLKKVQSGFLRIYMTDLTEQYHAYWDDGTINNFYGRDQGEYNMVLLPRMNIANSFTDPNWPNSTNPKPIKTFRDYLWYQLNVPDSTTFRTYLYHFLPSKIFLDTANISVEWKNTIRDKITEINQRYVMPTLEETPIKLDDADPGNIDMQYPIDTLTWPLYNKVGQIIYKLDGTNARILGASFQISQIKGLSIQDSTLQRTFDRLTQMYFSVIKSNPDNRYFSTYTLEQKPLNGPSQPNQDEINLANFLIALGKMPPKPGVIRINNIKY